MEKRKSSIITFIPGPITLHTFFKAIYEKFDIIGFHIEKDQIIIRSIDPSRISILKATIPITQGRRKISMDLYFETKDLILALEDLKGIVSFEVRDHPYLNKKKLIIFRDNILEKECPEVENEDLSDSEVLIEYNLKREYKTFFDLHTKDFIRIIHALNSYSSLFYIEERKGVLTLTSKKYKIDAKATPRFKSHFVKKENQKSCYSLDFILTLNEGLENNIKEILVSFNTDEPLKVEYILKRGLNLTLTQAPRVEEADY
jgi:hypothetical protein